MEAVHATNPFDHQVMKPMSDSEDVKPYTVTFSGILSAMKKQYKEEYNKELNRKKAVQLGQEKKLWYDYGDRDLTKEIFSEEDKRF